MDLQGRIKCGVHVDGKGIQVINEEDMVEFDPKDAEIERLRGAWKDAGERCPQCGTGNPNINRLTRERDELRGLVEAAYLEGWSAGFQTDRDDYMCAGKIRGLDWSRSTARALLDKERPGPGVYEVERFHDALLDKEDDDEAR